MTDLQVSLKYYQNKRAINILIPALNRLHLCMGDEKPLQELFSRTQMVTPGVQQCLSDFERRPPTTEVQNSLKFSIFLIIQVTTVKLRPIYQSHRELQNNTKHETTKNIYSQDITRDIWIFLLLGEKSERGEERRGEGVINEQGERCCLLSLEISSPGQFYGFIAWHLQCVSS